MWRQRNYIQYALGKELIYTLVCIDHMGHRVSIDKVQYTINDIVRAINCHICHQNIPYLPNLQDPAI